MGNYGFRSLRSCERGIGLTELTVDAEDGETELFGKDVADLQEDVAIDDDFAVTGTLKYVDDYTGFSEDTDLQEGNFLALKFSAREGATVTVELVDSEEGEVQLDDDMNCVLRITDVDQTIKVKAAYGPHTKEVTLTLADIVLDTEEVSDDVG